MTRWISRHYEAAWVWLAARILMGRNFKRCRDVSRRDNNDMWHEAEKLDAIARRMRRSYRD